MIQTTLCYIRQGDAYLMLHRVNRKKQEGEDLNAGKWVGFGGKFLEGETPEQCVLREVLEETGLRLTRYAYRGVIDFLSDRYPDEQMHLFTADGFEGELIECDEGEIAWIPIADYLSLPMWEGDRIFLERIADPNAPFFRLTLRYEDQTLAKAILDGTEMKSTERGWEA